MPTDSTNEEVENTPHTPTVGMCEPPGAVSRFTYAGAKRPIEFVEEVCSDVVEEFERDTEDKTGAEEVDFSEASNAPATPSEKSKMTEPERGWNPKSRITECYKTTSRPKKRPIRNGLRTC